MSLLQYDLERAHLDAGRAAVRIIRVSRLAVTYFRLELQRSCFAEGYG